MEIKKQRYVKTTTKYNLTDAFLEPLLVSSRKCTEGIIDSPIFLNLNKYWLVKHNKSCLVRGISIGYYAVYREDELEVITEFSAPNNSLF